MLIYIYINTKVLTFIFQVYFDKNLFKMKFLLSTVVLAVLALSSIVVDARIPSKRQSGYGNSYGNSDPFLMLFSLPQLFSQLNQNDRQSLMNAIGNIQNNIGNLQNVIQQWSRNVNQQTQVSSYISVEYK